MPIVANQNQYSLMMVVYSLVGERAMQGAIMGNMFAMIVVANVIRIDVWFNGPDGHLWHGVNYGHNSQLCHCRRTRKPSNVKA